MHPYEVGTWLHRGWVVHLRGQRKLPGRTISVGNIAWGGTGKTSLCEWLARRLGLESSVVLSRGYKGGDEAAMLRAKGVQVVVGKERFKAATQFLIKNSVKVKNWILDDGFQHWGLARDLDIVMIDASCPFGVNGRLIPFGSLRESPERGLKRASGIVLHNSDLVREDEMASLERSIRSMVPSPKVPVVRSFACCLPSRALQESTAQRWIIFSGIGNNDAFFQKATRLAQELGRSVISCIAFRDHHEYKPRDVRMLQAYGRHEDVAFVTTEKDLARPSSSLLTVLDCKTISGDFALSGGDIGEFHKLIDG